jgi:hypothetical protein
MEYEWYLINKVYWKSVWQEPLRRIKERMRSSITELSVHGISLAKGKKAKVCNQPRCLRYVQ